MTDSPTYGNSTKRIVFTENDHRHAQLVLKLKYMRLTQAAFFRHVVTGLIEDDPRIMEYTNDICFKSKARKAKSQKALKNGAEKLRDFGLSTDDVEDIFDLIEKDGPKL
tara:strand:- start:436 stop:762 length:327 start_codon:yes stop_codon:yes gene_type:complete